MFAGLFKEEWSGDGFIGIAAKSYFCYDKTDPTKDKCSAKGVSRHIKMTREYFLDVLTTKTSCRQTNKGFIMKDKNIFTYELNKDALTFTYVKRKVLNDGVSTTYLDL